MSRDIDLKILQISTYDHGGGAESVARELFNKYRDRGHTSKLLVGYKKMSDPDIGLIPNASGSKGLRRVLWWLDTYLHPWQGRVRGTTRVSKLMRLMAAPGAWRETSQGIENFNFPGTWQILDSLGFSPDIIHCHNLHGDYFDLRALPDLSLRAPTILHLHDAWLLSGHCAHSLGCDRWRIGCGECPDLSIYPAVKQDATAFNWARKKDIYAQSHLYLTAPSQWLIDKAKESMLQGVEYRVIPNGIDTSLFRPGEKMDARTFLNLPQDAAVVLLAANNEFKDLEMMKRALSHLREQDRPLLSICIGRSGSEEQLGEGLLLYTGMISDPEDVSAYYRAADVYIHAAKDEAFGKTITEAMASGCPVVATRTGGIPEQIIDGVTGFLCNPQDARQMAKHVQYLLNNPILSTSMGEAGHSRVEKYYSLDTQVATFLDWYQEIRQDYQSRFGEDKSEGNRAI